MKTKIINRNNANCEHKLECSKYKLEVNKISSKQVNLSKLEMKNVPILLPPTDTSISVALVKTRDEKLTHTIAANRNKYFSSSSKD